jgi:CBS-domain-containing membrane protein
MAPFGASCVMLFSAPGSPLSQPASVIVGHIVSTGIGLALRVLLLMEWWSMGLAIAIAAMAALRVTHPPAGADPLVLVLDNPEWGISGCPSRLEV